MLFRCRRIVSFIPFLFVLLLAASYSADGQVTRTSVAWSVPQVTQNLGDGSLSNQRVVTFRVNTAQSNVSVIQTGESSAFVSVSPPTFAQLQPGTDYSVTMTYSLPPQSQAGARSGRLFLRTATRDIGKALPLQINVSYGTNQVSPSVLTLSQASNSLVSGIAPDGTTLTFGQANPEISAIAPGRILAIPPTANAPNGFLGRVVSTSTTGGQVSVATSPAALSDVFTRANVNLTQALRPSETESMVAATEGVSIVAPSPNAPDDFNFALDNVSFGNSVAVNGNISVAPQMNFELEIDGARLRRLSYTFSVTQTASLSVLAGSTGSVDREITLLTVRGTPIVVWVGFVPLVFIPETSLVLKGSGTVGAGVTFGVGQSATATLGVGYANGSWTPIASFSSSRNSTAPTYTVTMNLKAGVGPRFRLLLYGIVGPQVDGVSLFGEFDVDLSRNPKWQLYGGAEASASVNLSRIDSILPNYNLPVLLQVRVLIAEGGGATGRITGQVRDAVSNTVLPNSLVTVFKDNVIEGSALTNASGQFNVEAAVGSTYRLDISRSGYITASYQNISVTENEVRTLEVILQISDANAGNGTVSGTVSNSVTGAGVPGLTINLRSGINATAGPIVRTTTTGAGGTYSISALPAGNYTAEATGTGYNRAFFSILCIGNTTRGNQNGTISPTLPPGQVRIVLTWGPTPADLDSHFYGPLPSGGSFHVFYANPNVSGVANLDLDDVTSFGPETTTLLSQIAGVYRFAVHDYTNRNSTSSSALSQSGAQIRVYRGSDQIGTFNVPIGQAATLWTVFELEGSTLRPVNTMTFSSAPRGTGDDDGLLNLPEKTAENQAASPSEEPPVEREITTGADAKPVNEPVTGNDKSNRASPAAACPPATFSNSTAIALADNANASPYGSAIIVSGLTGNIAATPGSVEVSLAGLTHTFPDDLGLVLVGPTGVSYLLQNGATDHLNGNPAQNLTYTISDLGTASIPNDVSIANGTFYRPASYYIGDNFPSPGPSTGYQSPAPAGSATLTSAFGGTVANGTWRLFVVDFASSDSGTIANGWTLKLTTDACTGNAVEGDIVDATGGPGGDGLVLANDVSVIRQMILGTVTPLPGSQFQRTDTNLPCGNGAIDAGDVTIIRQYNLGTLAPATACGPTGPTAVSSNAASDPPRGSGTTIHNPVSRSVAGELVKLSFMIVSDGAAGSGSYTINFPSDVLTYVSSELGSGVPSDAFLSTTTAQAESGRLGVLIDSTNTFAKGTNEMLTVTFAVSPNARAGKYPITVDSSLTRFAIFDKNGRSLTPRFTGGGVEILGVK